MNKVTREMMQSPVSSIMTTRIIAVLPTDTLGYIDSIFKEHKIHHLPVVRHLDLQGIISKTDFYASIHSSRVEDPITAESINRELFNLLRAEDIMTRGVVKLAPTDTVGTAAEIFLENHFHSIPIVNEDDELVGIVTTYDIIKLIFNEAYPQ